jgi:hypothetical protein
VEGRPEARTTKIDQDTLARVLSTQYVLFEKEQAMSRYSKKVQVLLTEEQYRELVALAAREHKKIGVVVREALEQTCLRKTRTREKAAAIRELLSMEPIDVPEDYQEWEEEYPHLKWAGHGCSR